MHEHHYIALIHKDTDSGYGISFPDFPGITAVADTLDQAIAEGAAALDIALEDWTGDVPPPRSLDALWHDAGFRADASDAVVAVVRPSAHYYQAAE